MINDKIKDKLFKESYYEDFIKMINDKFEDITLEIDDIINDRMVYSIKCHNISRDNTFATVVVNRDATPWIFGLLLSQLFVLMIA